MRLLQRSTAVPPLVARIRAVYLPGIEPHRAAVKMLEAPMLYTHNLVGISFVVAAVILLGLMAAL